MRYAVSLSLGRKLGRNEAEAAVRRLLETLPGPKYVVAASGQLVALGDQVRHPGAHVLRQGAAACAKPGMTPSS